MAKAQVEIVYIRRVDGDHTFQRPHEALLCKKAARLAGKTGAAAQQWVQADLSPHH